LQTGSGSSLKDRAAAFGGGGGSGGAKKPAWAKDVAPIKENAAEGFDKSTKQAAAATSELVKQSAPPAKPVGPTKPSGHLGFGRQSALASSSVKDKKAAFGGNGGAKAVFGGGGGAAATKAAKPSWVKDKKDKEAKEAKETKAASEAKAASEVSKAPLWAKQTVQPVKLTLAKGGNPASTGAKASSPVKASGVSGAPSWAAKGTAKQEANKVVDLDAAMDIYASAGTGKKKNVFDIDAAADIYSSNGQSSKPVDTPSWQKKPNLDEQAEVAAKLTAAANAKPKAVSTAAATPPVAAAGALGDDFLGVTPKGPKFQAHLSKMVSKQ
jgi:hypothetical protein